MRAIFTLFTSCLLFIGGMQSATANDNHKALMKKSELERTFFWADYMKQISANCKVTEDYFMGFDKDNAAYWSVDCNKSRDDGFLVQIPASANAKTKQFPCSVGKMIGVPCFKKLD